MLTAVVTQTGETISVQLIGTAPPATSEEETATTEATTGTDAGTESGGGESHGDNVVETDDGLVAKDGVAHVPVDLAAPGPNPIVPELKEVVWGAGAFIVFALIMRYVAFPKLKKGMDARYDAHPRRPRVSRRCSRRCRTAEVAEYQAQLAAVKAEAANEIDAARQQLEAERTARLAEVNADDRQLRRTERTAEADAARAAVQGQVEAAVVDVATSAAQAGHRQEPRPRRRHPSRQRPLSAGAAR